MLFTQLSDMKSSGCLSPAFLHSLAAQDVALTAWMRCSFSRVQCPFVRGSWAGQVGFCLTKPL